MGMVRFGIIGCGAIHHIHLEAIRSAGGVISACCDSDEEKARKTARSEGCSYYTDYKMLIADQTVDVVVILTPHYLHKEMSLAALNGHKHVLCEKPMATTVAEAEEILAAAAKTYKYYHVCYQNRFNPSFLAMEQLISQDLGELEGVKAEVSWNREAAYYADSSWKGTWEKEGGGVLINQAIHTIDAVCHFAGVPKKIKGKIMTSFLEGLIEVEDAAIGTGLINEETKFVLYASNNYAKDSSPRITFDYTDGQAVLTNEALWFNNCALPLEHFERSTVAKEYWGNGHLAVYQALMLRLEGIENHLTKLLAITDAFDSLQVVCGLYESNKKNEWVELRAPIEYER